jgi:hypothetical protein
MVLFAGTIYSSMAHTLIGDSSGDLTHSEIGDGVAGAVVFLFFLSRERLFLRLGDAGLSNISEPKIYSHRNTVKGDGGIPNCCDSACASTIYSVLQESRLEALSSIWSDTSVLVSRFEKLAD